MKNIFFQEKYLFFLICFFGIFLRYYNYSFDDLWYDEIISFYISNPEFSFQETLKQNNLIDINIATYHFLLKFIFTFFGYTVENGRLFSVILSSLSIFTVSYLSWIISRNKSYLFTSFLLSFNIFLISYSQELRVYTTLFFFASLSLIFFIKILKKSKFTFALYVFYFFVSLILVALHPFAIIIFLSYLLYLILHFYKYKKKNIHLFLSNLIVLIFASLIYFQSFKLAAGVGGSTDYFWMTNPDLKFFTNFYFSSFFGSRLLGLIFLFVFIFLIAKNLKKIKNLEIIVLLLSIIFLSYFLPIVFGIIFEPVLVNRYIIFVLIPINLVIAILAFEIKNKLKIILISLLVILTFGNHFTEQTFRQFFQDRIVSKPEYTAAMKFIEKSGNKNYILKVTKMKNEQATINAINNYIEYLNKKNNFELKFWPGNKISVKIWHICFQDFNGKDCKIENVKNFNVLETKNFNNIELKLIE